MDKEESLRFIDAERISLKFNIEFYEFTDHEGNKTYTLEKIKDSQERIAHYKNLFGIDDEQEEDTWEPRD